MIGLLFALGAAIGLVVLVVTVVRGRRGAQVQRVRVDGPREWAGPAFLNGSARTRLPSALPRPTQDAAFRDVRVRRARRRSRAASRFVLVGWRALAALPVRTRVLLAVAGAVWVLVLQTVGGVRW